MAVIEGLRSKGMEVMDLSSNELAKVTRWLATFQDCVCDGQLGGVRLYTKRRTLNSRIGLINASIHLRVCLSSGCPTFPLCT